MIQGQSFYSTFTQCSTSNQSQTQRHVCRHERQHGPLAIDCRLSVLKRARQPATDRHRLRDVLYILVNMRSACYMLSVIQQSFIVPLGDGRRTEDARPRSTADTVRLAQQWQSSSLREPRTKSPDHAPAGGARFHATLLCFSRGTTPPVARSPHPAIQDIQRGPPTTPDARYAEPRNHASFSPTE